MATKRAAALLGIFRALRDSRRPGAPGLGKRFAAMPRLIAATLRGRYRGIGRSRLAMMVLALLYIVSPVDLAPELFLALFGVADDALLAVWLVGGLLDEAGRFIAWERSRPIVVPGEATETLRGLSHP